MWCFISCKSRPLLSVVSAALFWVACSQQTASPVPTPDMADPIPKDAIALSTGPISVRAGSERTVCVTGKFPLATPVDVIQIATRQSATHHVIFYRFNQGATAPETNTVPIDCPPFDLLGGGAFKVPLFIGESSDQSQNVLKLPPSVAYHFEPNDYYRIEVHAVNASVTDVMPSVDVLLSAAAPDTQVIYADMLFYNNTKALNKNYDGISGGLPPMAKTTADAAFGKVPSSFKVFGLTTHQHRLGTGVTVAKSSGISDAGSVLFTNTDWQHPSLFRLPDDQPLLFGEGEGLRWTCEYNNTTGNHVKFGESGLTDEMCIIWGYYYPSGGFQVYWN